MKGSGYTTAHFGKWHLSGGGPWSHMDTTSMTATPSNDDAAPHVAPNPGRHHGDDRASRERSSTKSARNEHAVLSFRCRTTPCTIPQNASAGTH